MADRRGHHHEASRTVTVDLRQAFHQKKRNASLLSALSAIHALCGQVKERQHTARQLHTRLHQVFLRGTSATTYENGTAAIHGAERAGEGMFTSSRRAASFAALLEAFQLTLKRHIKFRTNIIRRVLHHRLFSLQLRSIHHQLTAFLKETKCDLAAFPVEWRSAFDAALGQDESVLHETLMTVVKSTSFLSKEYMGMTTRQQMEVLLDVRVERTKPFDLSPVLEDCLATIYRRLVRLFNWDLSEKSRRVPRWFVPLSSVEFSTSRDLLTKAKPTYRGEIALEERGGWKRHLVVLKCFSGVVRADAHVDEAVQILDEYVHMYGAIDHANVLRVRGANYVAGAPFIVRDYANQGTLSGHLARLRHVQSRQHQFDESITWRLLADACEGLLAIHEHHSGGGIAHGGLKGSNLLVNHRGLACVADSGVRVLRQRLRTAYTSDDEEYVRWQAPELIPGTRLSPSTISGTTIDVYAFGMCIIEVLTAQLPWATLSATQIETIKLSNETALPPRPSGISTKAWRLVQKMCAADPATRLPLRQVYHNLLQLSRENGGNRNDEPESEDLPTATLNQQYYPRNQQQANDGTTLEEEEEKEGDNEFETESVSSYKTTIELSDEEENGVPGDPAGQDQALHEGDGLDDTEADEAKRSGDEGEEPDEEDNTAYDDYDGTSSLPVTRAFDSMAMDPQCHLPIGLQTNGQMKDAIEFLADSIDCPPQTLLPHLELVRAFAKQDAQSIHESGGIRVLNALLLKHKHDTSLLTTTLAIYQSILAAGHVHIAESLVDQGLVAVVFQCLVDKQATNKDVCLSLLLELMSHTDHAKRQIGSKKEYVTILEQNGNAHRRLLTEIKSVLARFKQMEGNELLKEGFHALAIPKFTEAIQLDRRRGIYYADRSLALCQAHRYHEAVEDAERCVRYTPFDVQGYLRYGIAMRHLNKYAEALAALRKGYQVNPHSQQLTLVMGEVQELYNKHKLSTR